jgi:hypothetical protein
MLAHLKSNVKLVQQIGVGAWRFSYVGLQYAAVFRSVLINARIRRINVQDVPRIWVYSVLVCVDDMIRVDFPQTKIMR